MLRMTRKRMFEMAFDKREYQKSVDSLLDQIAQNWCLCMYCHLYFNDHRDYHVWKKELRKHLYNLARRRLSSGDKERYTRETVINKAEFNTLPVVRLACDYKFREEESLFPEQDKKDYVYNLFINTLDDLILCIAGNLNIEYCLDRWFPEVS